VHRVANIWQGISLTQRVLLPLLAALIAALVSIQLWTLQGVRTNELARAQAQLDVNLKLLEHLLRPLGTEWKLEGNRLSLGGGALNDQTEIVDTVRRIGGGVATLFAGDLRVATNVMKPDGSRATGTRLAAGPAFDAAIRDGRTYRGENPILGVNHLTVYQPVRDAAGKPVGLLFVGVPLQEAEAAVGQILRESLIATAILATLAGLLLWGVVRWNIRPITRLAGAMEAVAGGALDTKVPARDRRDEIGHMAGALDTFIAAARDARRIEAEATATRNRSIEERSQSLRDMAGQIEVEASSVIETVSEHMAGVLKSADLVASTNARMAVDSDAVAGAAQQSLVDAQAVAAAVEQLSASVREIAGQVSGATAATQRAVTEGEASVEGIHALAGTVAKISDITRLISEIASQTNLLALNATIEAARAGEAGKGFAVVAGEVKSLAAQTAKATGEIAAQVSAIDTATKAAVARVGGIAGAVSEIDQVAAAIAAAVEQQSAATQEIARSIARTADGARQVSELIAGVSTGASVAEDTARAMRERATGARDAMIALRPALAATLRDTVSKIDRRAFRRLLLPQSCGVNGPGLPGGRASTTLRDISLGGAAIDWSSGPVRAGQALELEVPDLLTEVIPAIVVSQSDNALRLRFSAEPATVAALTAALDRYAAAAAA